MMKPEPPLRWACSSSSPPSLEGGRRRGVWRRGLWASPVGLGEKNSNGSKPPKLRRAVCTTSVVVMETTAGATREARSANEGTATEAIGPDEVWVGLDCALHFRIRP